nr:hypothetical protein BaRGS_025830 [Batillaria attramentaria]
MQQHSVHVYKELSLIKQRLNQPEALPGQLRELLPRIIFCSVIGYDVSFCKIHAIKLAQSNTLMEKRAGYLATTLLLHPGEEIAILMTCGLQKDLTSSNMLDNCQALTAAAYLIATEYVPLMLPAVLSCLNHKRELISLLKVLGTLGMRDHDLAAAMLATLEDIMREVNPREPISLAVVYQCVLTVAKLGQSCQKKEDKEGSLESVDQGRFSPDPKWYLDTLLPILSLSIDPQVVLATAENMLQYLIKASTHQSWPEFSEQLFLMMVGKIQKADISTETHILQFALRLLRFVPMQVLKFWKRISLFSKGKLLMLSQRLE